MIVGFLFCFLPSEDKNFAEKVSQYYVNEDSWREGRSHEIKNILKEKEHTE